MQPIANEAQLNIIEAHVADAVRKGAKLVTGGRRTGVGLGYLPTLLDGCTDAMDVVREETFGPVLAVVRFLGVDEAIRGINASSYGLGASIWSADVARAERLSARLNVGVVNINNHGFTGAVAALPWTGTRATGLGVANSVWSLLTFCRPKTVVVDTSAGPEPFWMPFDATLRELGEALAGGATWTFAPGLEGAAPSAEADSDDSSLFSVGRRLRTCSAKRRLRLHMGCGREGHIGGLPVVTPPDERGGKHKNGSE